MLPIDDSGRPITQNQEQIARITTDYQKRLSHLESLDAATADPIETFATPATEGLDFNRTTGGTYLYAETELYIKVPCILSAVYWDLRSGTYTVTWGGEYGVSVRDLGTQILGAATDDVEFSDNLPMALYPGVYRLRCTRTALDNWRDHNNAGAGFDGNAWYRVNTYYDGAVFNNYVLPHEIEFAAGNVYVSNT